MQLKGYIQNLLRLNNDSHNETLLNTDSVHSNTKETDSAYLWNNVKIKDAESE